jgi:N-acetylmuramic acid 6-phosphate etherase
MAQRRYLLCAISIILAAMNSESLPLTEQQNPRSENLDSLSAFEIISLMNEEDSTVAFAVSSAMDQIARAVEEIVSRMERGGRLFYVGTGTSGRLGVLDASECPPTFGVPPDLIQGVIAGGYDACHKAVEASEDNREQAALDLLERGVKSDDIVVGITASGSTVYTIGALEYANSIGLLSVSISCVPNSPITKVADISIVVAVGPEVVTGSTRLKAGTAQKMVLNMLSTATLVKLGYVSGNLMTNLQPKNRKLQTRAIRILAQTSNLDEEKANEALEKAGGDLKIALVMVRTGCSQSAAKEALSTSNGVVNKAIDTISESSF